MRFIFALQLKTNIMDSGPRTNQLFISTLFIG